MRVGTGRVWYRGGYTRVGTGRAIPGTQPAHPAARGASPDSEAGPGRALQGPWSGWSAGPGITGDGGGQNPPCGPGRYRPAVPPWFCPDCRLSANSGEIPVISYKVSQNREVSPKKHEKAYVSPCFQNGLKKSPLEILRFPVSRAFSPKELMGHFDPYLGLYGQNDEVSLDGTHMCSTRKGRMIPPRSPQQAAPGDRSSSCSARETS